MQKEKGPFGPHDLLAADSIVDDGLADNASSGKMPEENTK